MEIADHDTVSGFREKPELPYEINAGIYIISPGVVDLLPDRGDHEETTFPQLAKAGSLIAHRSKAFWRTIDTAKDLGELRSELEGIFLNSLFQSTKGHS